MSLPIPTAWARAAAACLAAVLLAGCATLSPAPEAAVKERATKRWASLLANDFDAAYGYMPPSFRAITTLDSYKRTFQGAVRWVAADVLWVKCETDDKCVARMKIDAQYSLSARSSAPLTSHFDETWIREDGRWWLFPTP